MVGSNARFWMLTASAAALLGAMPQAASAQANSANATVLEDIIVTAQRREERLQEVPIAVTAASAAMLEQRGIKTNEELVQIAPALNIGRSGSTPLLYLRGVGNQSGSPGSEPSVPLYIDGVYVLGQNVTLFAFNNIDRVEVLRGPQGTLFGRNATGGLIHIVTKTPSHTTSGQVKLGYGNHETYEGSFYGTTGLTDTIAADLSVYGRKRANGFGYNTFRGTDVYKSEEYAVRAKMLWTPTDDTRVTLTADYLNQNSDIGLVRTLRAGIIGLDGVTRWNGVARNTSVNQDPKSIIWRSSGVLKVEQDFSFARFISITAYQSNRDKWILDSDGTPAFVLQSFTADWNQGWTQEFQLQSASDSALQWVAGAYFLDSHIKQDPQLLVGSRTGAAQFFRRYGSIKTGSISGFGQATWEDMPGTKVTGGLRWTQDKKDLMQAEDRVTGPGAVRRDSLKNSKLTYRFAVDHDLSEGVMLYGTLSRGYKSGEFNLTSTVNPPIRPETLDAIEGGIKSELLDRRLRLNVTAFHYKYKDLQLSQQLGGSTLTLNAAKARIWGAEAEVEAVLAQGLTLNASAAYLHGRYRDFPNAPQTYNEPYTCATATVPGGPRPTDPNFGNQNCFGDNSGRETVRSPPFTGNVSLNYATPVAGGTMKASGTVAYTDRFFFETDNRLRQNAYTLVNGEVSWTAPSDAYTVRAWVKNLFDKYYAIGASASTADQDLPAEPRTFGVEVSYRF